MKIINRTHYQTRDLRKFVVRCWRMVFHGSRHSKARWRRLVVEFEYTRQSWHTPFDSGGSSGCAFVGGDWMCVRLSRHKPDRVDLAHVIEHELGHIKGLRHADMGPHMRSRSWAPNKERLAWALELPLNVKPQKPQPTAQEQAETRRQAKIENARAKLAEWENKRKRAENKVKRWQAEVRRLGRYQRQMMVAAIQRGKGTE